METEVRKIKPECSKYNSNRFIRTIFCRICNSVNWLFNTELGIYCLLTVIAFIWAVFYAVTIFSNMSQGY